MIVSIDPGVHGCGVAWWEGFVDYELVHARYVGADKSLRRSKAWDNTVLAVSDNTHGQIITRVVIELPQVYGTWSQSKGDPNDLIQLAAVVGGLAQLWSGKTEIVLPREWKGGASKKATKARLTEYQLTESELGKIVETKNKDDNTDIWDAVGIGIFWLEDQGLRKKTRPKRWEKTG